jgi:hypothetical protein
VARPATAPRRRRAKGRRSRAALRSSGTRLTVSEGSRRLQADLRAERHESWPSALCARGEREMRRAVRAVFGISLVALVIATGASSKSQNPFPGYKLDLRSFDPAPVSLDVLATSGSGAITGSGNPPRVGPNIRVNAAQQGAPNGLFGRSETTLTIDRNNIVAGWNDAQGFCGPPFNAACTPQSPAGLSPDTRTRRTRAQPGPTVADPTRSAESSAGVTRGSTTTPRAGSTTRTSPSSRRPGLRSASASGAAPSRDPRSPGATSRRSTRPRTR